MFGGILQEVNSNCDSLDLITILEYIKFIHKQRAKGQLPRLKVYEIHRKL